MGLKVNMLFKFELQHSINNGDDLSIVLYIFYCGIITETNIIFIINMSNIEHLNNLI